MSIQSIPYITLLGLFYGSTLIASRFSVGQFNPSTYLGLRLTLASLAYLLIFALGIQGRRWPRDRRLWKHATVLGVLGSAMPMTAIIYSLQYQSSGMTSMLITAGPAITVVMAHYTLPDESLTLRKAVGVVLALSGALLLVVLGESGLPDVTRANPLGYGLVIGAMLLGSFTAIYTRKYMQDLDTFEVTSVRIFTAAAAVFPLSLLLVGFDLSQVNRTGLFALGWASIFGTFLAMLLAFYVIQRFGATASAMTAYVIPIVASVGGLLVLGEEITASMLGGMAIIALGIAIINQPTSTLPKPEGEMVGD